MLNNRIYGKWYIRDFGFVEFRGHRIEKKRHEEGAPRRVSGVKCDKGQWTRFKQVSRIYIYIFICICMPHSKIFSNGKLVGCLWLFVRMVSVT